MTKVSNCVNESMNKQTSAFFSKAAPCVRSSPYNYSGNTMNTSSF